MPLGQWDRPDRSPGFLSQHGWALRDWAPGLYLRPAVMDPHPWSVITWMGIKVACCRRYCSHSSQKDPDAAQGGARATWSPRTMRGVFEPPIDWGAIPVTQRSLCRPSLSLSIATRHLPQAPSPLHSLTPFFCPWPGSPRHNTEAAMDAWPDWLIWLWKMPFLSSTYCLRIRGPTALISLYHLFPSYFSPSFPFCFFFFFPV